MSAGRIFSMGGGGKSLFFRMVTKSIFPGGGPAVVKFHFTNSKQREKHFSTKSY